MISLVSWFSGNHLLLYEVVRYGFKGKYEPSERTHTVSVDFAEILGWSHRIAA